MSVGKKTGGRDIVKGQVLNPDGRPRVPKDIKDARRMNRIDFTRIANKLLLLNKAELTEKYNDKSTGVLELVVCKIVQEAINKGDHRRLDFLLDRIIGPVPKAVALISNEPHAITQPARVIMLPRNGREKQPERAMGEPEEIEVVDVEEITEIN